MVVGAALTGTGKFTLPLVFPLAFKYVIDVLLASQPKLDRINLIIDRWCAWLAQAAHLTPTSEHKLAALSGALLLIYALQSIASYYRNYWAGVAGNRLIFELRCKLFAHLQQLPHTFFRSQSIGGSRVAGVERRTAGA
jgi:ABC-type multidrug transport system fused ATPase/permease subunit